jgi:hypothetical protein
MVSLYSTTFLLNTNKTSFLQDSGRKRTLVYRDNTFNIIREKIGSDNNFLCKYSTKQLSPPQFSGNSRSELTNINGKACNNIPEAINKLALSARLGHFCERHDSSHYSKQNSIFKDLCSV